MHQSALSPVDQFLLKEQIPVVRILKYNCIRYCQRHPVHSGCDSLNDLSLHSLRGKCVSYAGNHGRFILHSGNTCSCHAIDNRLDSISQNRIRFFFPEQTYQALQIFYVLYWIGPVFLHGNFHKPGSQRFNLIHIYAIRTGHDHFISPGNDVFKQIPAKIVDCSVFRRNQNELHA